MIRDGGQSQSERLRTDAEARAEKVLNTADTSGLYALFGSIGVNATDVETRQRYISYFALREEVEQAMLASQSSST